MSGLAEPKNRGITGLLRDIIDCLTPRSFNVEVSATQDHPNLTHVIQEHPKPKP